MARISAGDGTSHVPAIGIALDLGKSGEPYWQPLFAATSPRRHGPLAKSPTSSSWCTTIAAGGQEGGRLLTVGFIMPRDLSMRT